MQAKKNSPGCFFFWQKKKHSTYFVTMDILVIWETLPISKWNFPNGIFVGWRPPSNFRGLLLHLAHQRPGPIDPTGPATGRLGRRLTKRTLRKRWTKNIFLLKLYHCMIRNTLKVWLRHDYIIWITLNNYQYIKKTHYMIRNKVLLFLRSPSSLV